MSVRTGVVSVVTINFRGTEDTLECLSGLGDLDWPPERLEIVCVENASGDDSATRIRTAFPDIKLVESAINGGFTGGCNLGAERASGEYLAFLNNDARPDPAWLSAAIAALEVDPTVGCIASKVLDWDGKVVDYVDAGLKWYGMGYKPWVTRPDNAAWGQPKDVLFATGAAMVVRAELFRNVGGFDERFFMFYEDVDFGWRLNLLGHRVRYVPGSIAFHRHHATMDKFGSWRERFLLERNALMCLYKNLEDNSLARVLAPALALAVRRAIALGGDDSTALDLQRSPGGDGTDSAPVSKTTLTGAYAIDQFVAVLPSLEQTRQELQARRARSDADLLPLFRDPLDPARTDTALWSGNTAIVHAFGIADVFPNLGPLSKPVVPASTQTLADIAEQYRMVAAARASRVTELLVRVEESSRNLRTAERHLAREQEKSESLQSRLDRMIEGAERTERAGGKPKAAAPTVAAPESEVRRYARSLARRVDRLRGDNPPGRSGGCR